MAGYTTVLWDLDGTILDSAPGVYESFRLTFELLGLPQIADQQLKAFLGPPLTETFGKTLGFDSRLTQRCLDVYREIYLGGEALNAALFPGVLEVIGASKAAGITNSLATSKGISGVELAGEQFGFLGLFDFLGAADARVNRHTKSEVLTYALEGLAEQGADLSSVILVGDRIHDIEGAREHGIEVVLVEWGYGTPDEWALADYVVDTPAELAQLLGV